MFFVLQVAQKFNNIIHKQKYLVYQGALIHERTDQSAVLPPEESCGNRKNERRCNAPTATESFYHSKLNLSPHSALFKCAFLNFFSDNNNFHNLRFGSLPVHQSLICFKMS